MPSRSCHSTPCAACFWDGLWLFLAVLRWSCIVLSAKYPGCWLLLVAVGCCGRGRMFLKEPLKVIYIVSAIFCILGALFIGKSETVMVLLGWANVTAYSSTDVLLAADSPDLLDGESVPDVSFLDTKTAG